MRNKLFFMLYVSFCGISIFPTPLLRAGERLTECPIMQEWKELNTREHVRESMQEVGRKTAELIEDNVLDDDRSGHRQMQRFLEPKVAEFNVPETVDAWEKQAEELRQQALDRLCRGISQDCIEKKVDPQWHGAIDRGDYVIEKLTFEGYPPGVTVPALLYRPKELAEGQKVPVVLNCVGHFTEGMTREEEQKRSINLARRGMLSLNFDWVGFGQLRDPEESGVKVHNNVAWLELAGLSGAGAMYLPVRRALDILVAHTNADPSRVAVTGLSGGGWQAIILAALDTRVDLVAPNAGYVDTSSRIKRSYEAAHMVGDKEQLPVDLLHRIDYTHLTALVFPRPMLQIHNERDICFRPEDVRENIYEPVRGLYALAGRDDRLEMHVNTRPGTHNYQSDNRRAFYRFVEKHFFPHRGMSDTELHNSDDVLSAQELEISLPNGALRGSYAWSSTADRLIEEPPKTPAPPEPAGDLTKWRDKLRSRIAELLNFTPMEGSVKELKTVETDGWYEVETVVFAVGDDWELPGYVFTPPQPTGTILYFSDHGKGHAPPTAFGLLRARQRVVCVDIAFTGEMTARDAGRFGGIPNTTMMLLMDGLGERALGIRSTQLAALSGAASQMWPGQPVTLWARGREAAVAGLLTAALSDSKHVLVTRHLPDSLKELVADRTAYDRAPTLFCPYLLEIADIPHILEITPEGRYFDRAPREMNLF